MRGRPSLPIGKHGDIWTRREGKTYTAYCYYRDTDGVTRRVKASANKAEAARLKLQERLATRHVGSVGEIGPDSTVKQLADAWLAQTDVEQSTKDGYDRHTRNHILPALGNVRLREVTVGRVEGFINSKRETPAVARRCRMILQMMFALAARLDAVEQNVILSTTTVKTGGRVKALAWDDVQRFRAHIAAWAEQNPVVRQYVVDITDLFIATGLRPGELLGLLWSDIDFKARTLTVTGGLVRDSANGLHRKDTPKSEAGERTLVLPEFVWPTLARMKLAAKNEKVFAGREGGWRNPSNFHTTWREARGEEWKQVKPKDFRTAVATLIAREAGSEAAAGQLGHSSDAVTTKFYIERERKTQDNTAVLDRKAGGV